MGISENLKKIKEAVYGEEVRGAIHDAIHDCYEDGKSGSIDLIAREEIEALQVEADELKMLGYTVPTEMSVKNYVDSNRVFHQKVGRVCLGSLNWSYDSGGSLFISSSISDILDHDMTTTGKEYCFGYTYAPVSSSQMGNLTFRKAGLNNKTFYFKNSSYTSESAFKSAMADTYLYYELATEITYNIDGSEVATRLDEIKMLGWTTPPQMKVKNSVSSDGTFVQRVGRVCLGDMAWNYAETNKAFYSNSINALIKSNTTNLESSKLKSWGFTPYLSAFDTYSDNGMGVNGTTLYSKATSYTSASAFKSAMANTYLYYELASPVTKNVYDRNYFDEFTETLTSTQAMVLER